MALLLLILHNVPGREPANSLPIRCPSTYDTACLSGLVVLTLWNKMFCLKFIYITLQLYVYLNYEAFDRKDCVFLFFLNSQRIWHVIDI